MFERTEKTLRLLALLRTANGTVTYERIEAEMGEPVSDLREAIRRACTYLERDEGIVYACVPKVGYKRLSDAEKVESSTGFARRIRRNAIRGVTRINAVSDFTRLSNEEQLAATLRRTVFEAVQREVGEASA
jgi:hypothetical protein